MTRKAQPPATVTPSKAGRPRTTPVPVAEQLAKKKQGGKGNPPPATSQFDDPMEFLKAVWRGELNATATQLRAAEAAMPFLYKKNHGSAAPGKRVQAQEAAAEVVQAGRFSSLPPPLKLVNRK